MARLKRRTLLILLTAFAEGLVANSTAAEKVEVIEAKDSISISLAGKYRKYEGVAKDSINIKAKDSANITEANAHELEVKDQGEEPNYKPHSGLPYIEKGCLIVEEPAKNYAGGWSSRPPESFKDSKMTHDKCYYFCVEHKSLFMSFKDGDTCTCFDKYDYMHKPDPREPGERCDKPCVGNKKTNCGGNKASKVYALEVWIPKLPKKDCGKPGEVPHGKMICNTFAEDIGTERYRLKCDAECNKGYRLAQNTLKCDTAAGMWYGFVHCEPYLCLPPTPPIAFASKTCAGGAVDGVKHATFKVECPVSCLPGYDLKGNGLKCVEPMDPKESAGVLEGVARCEPKVCGHPKFVDKANYPVGVQAYPTSVLYTCQPGYTLNGEVTGLTYKHVKCQADGKFEDVQFQCIPLNCGKVPPIKNGKLVFMPPQKDGGVFFPGAPVYKCPVGFSMDGTGTGERVIPVPCQASGKFPDEPGSCKPVICGGPPLVGFSKLIKSDASKYNDEVVPLAYKQKSTLLCQPGYSYLPKHDPDRVNQEFVTTCEDDGLFSNVRVCAPVICGKPPTAAKTLRPDLVLHFGQHAEYSCLDGYSVTGKVEAPRGFNVYCLENRRFSELPPSKGCKPLECGTPSRVEHGKLVRGTPGEMVKFPEAIQYKCDEGFSIDRTKSSGAAVFVVSCESTGQFSDYWECLGIDDCVGHTCGPQGQCNDLHMNYECICDRGFEPIVNELTMEKECGNINDCGPEACGEGTCEDLVEGYKCHCPTGYEVTFPAEAPKNATCSKVICGTPPEVRKADRPNIKASYQDRVEYACQIGYTLNGRAGGDNRFHTECQANKRFTSVPRCRPVSCGRAPRRKYARVDKRGVVTYKQKIRYTCRTGYSTDGSSLKDTKSFGAECLETGFYTELMDCVPIICGAPKGLSFSSVPATVLTFRQRATYTCLQGYSVDGTPRRGRFAFDAICQANGNIGLHASGCQPISCGRAPKVRNAVAELAQGDIVYPMLSAFSCHEGFSLDGEVNGERVFTVKCEANGKYSGVKKCKNVECGKPPHPSHSRMIQGGRIEIGVFGDFFKYKCDKGYGLEPLPTDLEIIQPGGDRLFAVTCQANGEYSALSTCKNIDDCIGHTCGPHGTCVDGVAEYSCNCQSGFELQPNFNGEPYCGNVDDCGDHKCGSHGTCVDQINGYTCSCSMGYHIEKAGEDTMCKPNSCGDLPAVADAEHNRDTTELLFPMIVTYACKTGYSIDKTAATAAKTFQVQCDANGEIQNIQTCSKVTCAPPGGILNLKKGPDLTRLASYKDKLSYECNDGFTTSGEAGGNTKFHLECGSDGLFKPEIFPVCAPVKCGKPKEVKKANYPEQDMFYPAIVTYACDLGYSMDGTANEMKLGFTVKCKEDGKFTDVPLADPKCKRIKCGKFPDVANAKYNKNVHGKFGDSQEYKCKNGFSVDGAQQGQTSWALTCQANGQFSESFQCVPIVFEVLGQMKNAVNNAPVPGGKAVLTYKDHDDGVSPIISPGNRIGQFQLRGVREGKALIKYTAPGFIGAEIKIDVRNNIQVGTTADIAMSPVLSEDAWRAVLSWGKKPRDLDTHLYWKNRRSCHVYYARRRVDCPDAVKGILDVDDVSSYGPETLTFKNVGQRYNPRVRRLGARRAPILQYRIKNYSRRPNLKTRDDVRVKLYNGNRLVKEFKLGKDGEIKGRWWNVFELNGYTGQLIQ